MATKREMREEAIKRMGILELHPNVIRDFKDGILNFSEGGFIHLLDDEQKERVTAFEVKNNVLVYHVIKCMAGYDKCLVYLYVSNEDDEWYFDKEDMTYDKTTIAYVDNLSCDWCSEFGSIGFAKRKGTVVRTA